MPDYLGQVGEEKTNYYCLPDPTMSRPRTDQARVQIFQHHLQTKVLDFSVRLKI